DPVEDSKDVRTLEFPRFTTAFEIGRYNSAWKWGDGFSSLIREDGWLGFEK
ncbi:MAG: hypothetical protein Q9198_008028, partial [Flavoplaca austrocitrina]